MLFISSITTELLFKLEKKFNIEFGAIEDCFNEKEVDIFMDADETAIEFIENDDWECLVRPGKRIKVGKGLYHNAIRQN